MLNTLYDELVYSQWFYGLGLIIFGVTRTYKYSMNVEKFGMSIITVFKSAYDVANFFVLYIPLGIDYQKYKMVT